MESGDGGRGRGGVAAPPPRSRGPHGAQLPSAPGLCGTSRSESPSACPSPPHSSSGWSRPPPLRDSPLPQTGPQRAGAAAIGAPRPPYQGHPPQQSCPQTGGLARSRFWVQGHHFSPPSRLFVRRGSTPRSLRPSPLPPLVGTAPLDQAFFLSSSSYCWNGPEFSVFLSFHLCGILMTYIVLSFYKDRSALSGLVLFLSRPRGTSSGTDAVL